MILKPWETNHASSRPRRCPEQSTRYFRRGGTILEVLISLVIVAMLLQFTAQVSARVRASRRLARDVEMGSQAAMTWRLARERAESWALGEEGAFTADGFRWRLAMLAVDAAETGHAPDGAWRLLEISRANEPTPFWSVTLRLADLQSEGPEAGAETKPE